MSASTSCAACITRRKKCKANAQPGDKRKNFVGCEYSQKQHGEGAGAAGKRSLDVDVGSSSVKRPRNDSSATANYLRRELRKARGTIENLEQEAAHHKQEAAHHKKEAAHHKKVAANHKKEAANLKREVANLSSVLFHSSDPGDSDVEDSDVEGVSPP